MGLSSHFVTASGEDLAFEFPPGTRVLLELPDQPPEEATVTHANVSSWCAALYQLLRTLLAREAYNTPNATP